MLRYSFILFICWVSFSCTTQEEGSGNPTFLNYNQLNIDGNNTGQNRGVSMSPVIEISFSEPVDPASVPGAIQITSNQNESIKFEFSFPQSDSIIKISFPQTLAPLKQYFIKVTPSLRSIKKNNLFSEIQAEFTTRIDSVSKFPLISDEALLDKVQQQTFKFFWDFGHPVSGMARERNSSGDLVTTGGTGFGIMAIVTAIERGFITRKQGLDRVTLITTFLQNKADRFHGVYPHWMSGTTGKTIPFSAKDDGGDLVETSFLIAGLLCASEYFTLENQDESNLRKNIDSIWQSVEWNWHTKGGENVLFWHWSPRFNWDMNHKIQGWNEALITYVLAASSPKYSIPTSVYTKGWALDGNMKNGKTFYNYKLPLGPDLGGPLFFEHYSFLGINPTKLKDQYAEYWMQAVNHSLINYEYCKANPLKFYGYSASCWGLTASDTRGGYTAHSPGNDRGVISPTAALSSMPFTPKESMEALKFFYYQLGDKTFKEYGFIDAFSLHHAWFADSFLAIDQGPIIVMIENHRSGLIWNLLMRNRDVQSGLVKLGFTY